VGKGHALGGSFSRPVDYILGGWQLSSIYTYTAGVPLIFSSSSPLPRQ